MTWLVLGFIESQMLGKWSYRLRSRGGQRSDDLVWFTVQDAEALQF